MSKLNLPESDDSLCVSKKKAFDLEQEALAFEESNRAQYPRSQQYPYFCRDCGRYHLSSTSPEDRSVPTTDWNAIGLPATAQRKHGAVKALVTALWNEGKTAPEIAARIDRPTAQVTAIVRQLEVEAAKPGAQSWVITSLGRIQFRKNRVEAELARLAAEMKQLEADEQRQIEESRLKISWTDNDSILLKKEARSFMLSTEDAKTLIGKLEEFLTVGAPQTHV